MKNDFLTIPDAPNYEVDSQFLVRNKKTGRILKPAPPYMLVVLSTGVDNKKIHTSIFQLRRQAVAASKKDIWEPVPSLNYCYELNHKGQLRNARTKRLKEIRKNRVYDVSIDGRHTTITKSSLLWEVFGIYPKKRHLKIPIMVEKDTTRCHFPFIASAAKFLSTKIFYSINSLKKFLNKRITEIDGWKITYYPPKDLAEVTDTVTQWKGKRYDVKKASD